VLDDWLKWHPVVDVVHLESVVVVEETNQAVWFQIATRRLDINERNNSWVISEGRRRYTCEVLNDDELPVDDR